MFHNKEFITTEVERAKAKIEEAKRTAEAEFVEAKMAAKDEMAVEAEFKVAKTKMIAEAKAKMVAKVDLISNSIYSFNELKKISSDDNYSHLLGKGSKEHHTE
ncbi:hypothetical protein [Rickettsia endosymbiont of Oedothorax gibbosus]|uniref:hypothetical protein n=1 Tax=Rickettsia endosymbiont of Oedothorax gibbosus TaxID=931099 RepID=UPI002024365A|nr:hypothetical protein [Rickettsia endosymbiont of Oedothorax gibbosus]